MIYRQYIAIDHTKYEATYKLPFITTEQIEMILKSNRIKLIRDIERSGIRYIAYDYTTPEDKTIRVRYKLEPVDISHYEENSLHKIYER